MLEHKETQRIKQATTLPLLRSAADRIADQVNNNCPVSAPVLRSVVRNETEKAISELKREVQSLRAQLSNNTAKKNKKNTSKDFQQRNGKAAKHESTPNKSRGSRQGKGNATTAAEGKNKKQRSPAKRDGRKQRSGTKKTN